MDEEDEYGIPYDYYSTEGSLRSHPEDLPSSFLDDSLEITLGGGQPCTSQHHSFGECMRLTLV